MSRFGVWSHVKWKWRFRDRGISKPLCHREPSLTEYEMPNCKCNTELLHVVASDEEERASSGHCSVLICTMTLIHARFRSCSSDHANGFDVIREPRHDQLPQAYVEGWMQDVFLGIWKSSSELATTFSLTCSTHTPFFSNPGSSQCRGRRDFVKSNSHLASSASIRS